MIIEKETIKVQLSIDINFKKKSIGWEAWSSSLGSTHAFTKAECIRILKDRINLK